MDHIFRNKLSNILSNILRNVQSREAYDPNVPSRRFEGMLGDRTERPIIQKVGLLLDIRGVAGLSAYDDALKTLDAWFVEHRENVNPQCDISLGIISTEGYSFKRLDLSPRGFYRNLNRDLHMEIETDVHDWTEALVKYDQKAKLHRLDMLLIGLTSLPEPIPDETSARMKQMLQSLNEKIIWLFGSGSIDVLTPIDRTCKARFLQYAETVAETEMGPKNTSLQIEQSEGPNSIMTSNPNLTSILQSEVFLRNIKLFNRKERFYLINYAVGGFILDSEFVNKINELFGLEIPDNAYVTMDYHLDWIYASLFLASPNKLNSNIGIGPKGQKIYPRDKTLIKASIEDIDLLIAYTNGEICHLILLEAKCDDCFDNKQLISKVERLKLIFPDIAPPIFVKPHFGIMSQDEPINLNAKFAGWMCKPDPDPQNCKPYWGELPVPPEWLKITRCDAQGRDSDRDKFWRVDIVNNQQTKKRRSMRKRSVKI